MSNTQEIVAKHAAGQKLTAKEVEQLKAAQSKPWEKLQIQRSTYYKFKKLGMPEDTTKAKAWINERQAMATTGSGKIVVGGKTYTAQDLLDLRGKVMTAQAENLNLKNRMEKLNLEEREGRLIDADQQIKTLNKIILPLKKALDAMPENLAKALNPDDPDRAETILETELANIYEDLTKNLEK